MGWTLIEAQTLSNTATSVTLGSGGTIPQTYKTLKLVISARNSGSTTSVVTISLNGSASNFNNRYLIGNGASVFTNSSATTNYFIDIPRVGDTSDTFGSAEATIQNYAGSANKIISTDAVTENNGATAYPSLWVQTWSNTAAITSITLTVNNSESFAINSMFTLYGLK